MTLGIIILRLVFLNIVQAFTELQGQESIKVELEPAFRRLDKNDVMLLCGFFDE